MTALSLYPTYVFLAPTRGGRITFQSTQNVSMVHASSYGQLRQSGPSADKSRGGRIGLRVNPPGHQVGLGKTFGQTRLYAWTGVAECVLARAWAILYQAMQPNLTRPAQLSNRVSLSPASWKGHRYAMRFSNASFNVG